jgi:hypothetical protein
VCLQQGLRQGNLLGPLLFALTLQDALHYSQQAAPDVDILAGAVDVCLLGHPAATHVATACATTPAASAQ